MFAAFCQGWLDLCKRRMKKSMIMKKLLLGLTFALMCFPLSSHAQKFAYVDTDYILSQLPAYKSAQKQLDELSLTWQKEIETMQAEIEQMHKEYQAEKVVLTEDMQIKRENEIIEKERALTKYKNDKFGYEGELYKKRQELIQPIQDKVFEAINKVARENGLDFIFDRSGGVTMLVSNPKYDLSDEVLAELGVVPTEDNEPVEGDVPPDAMGGDLPPR